MMASAWFRKLVNAHQSSEVRRQKYAVVKAHGYSRSHADKWRDWRWSKLARLFGYASIEDLFLTVGLNGSACDDGYLGQEDD